jgi:hypothetical protein
MMNFMHEGGANMWLMLISALTVAGIAFTRAPDKRSGVLQTGTVLLVIEGMLGLATGMAAVAAFARSPKFAEVTSQAAVVAEGLGELSNNGILGAILALALGVAAIVVSVR